jgi:TolB-like protein/DNA-binding winged helix-turn-helix (wHTH) protein/Flp pilus assembly protein TadD
MPSERSHSRPAAGCFHFGRFVLDESSGELRRDGRPIPLRTQAVRILALLLRERGRLVPREQIRQEVWGADVHVEFDQGLNDCVRAIRAALGDDAREPRFIETLPRRGYRFIGELVADPAPAQPPEPRRAWPRRLAAGLVIGLAGLLVASAARTDVARRPSPRERVRIAVMPFQELSPEGDPYFADGLTEELIATLGALHPERLGVIARTTTREYARQHHDVASLADALAVDFVLEGSVRRQGDRARITAELIDARAQTLVWANGWDGDLRDILELQEDVARVVARAVRVSVRPDVEARLTRVRRVDPEAHRLYLEGRSYFNRMDVLSLRRSVELYRQALELQQDHALAWAGLAESYVMLGDYTAMESSDVARLSREAVERALAIDDSLAPAYVAQGVVRGMYEQRWDLAEQSFQRAIALNPAYPSARNWYAQLLRARGRVDAAVEQARMAVELDPLSGINGVNLGFALFSRGDRHEALQTFLDVLDVEPGYAPALLGLGIVQASLGRMDEADASLEQASGAAGGSALFDASLAYACATSGREARAREIAARMERARPRSAFLIGVVYAGLGDVDAAFEWLEASIEAHDPRARFIAADERLASLRADPRFQGLVERFRLAEPGSAGALF